MRSAARRAHRRLLTGVAAQLAPQHADRIVRLLAGAVVPALEGETPTRIGSPLTGWRHSRAASLSNSRPSEPFDGGAASR
jgi:hypothetical protein